MSLKQLLRTFSHLYMSSIRHLITLAQTDRRLANLEKVACSCGIFEPITASDRLCMDIIYQWFQHRFVRKTITLTEMVSEHGVNILTAHRKYRGGDLDLWSHIKQWLRVGSNLRPFIW